MDPSVVREPMTLDEWADLPEDVEGELVDGHLEEEEMASWVHEVIVAFLISVLRAWARPRGGLVFGSQGKLGLLPTRGRIPDACVYLAGHRPPARGAARVPPDIVVEIVTPTPRDQRRDRITKYDEYAAFGVAHYWIVDPEARTFEIFDLGPDGRYVRAVGASDGSVTPPGCEGLVVDLDAMWADADAVNGED